MPYVVISCLQAGILLIELIGGATQDVMDSAATDDLSTLLCVGVSAVGVPIHYCSLHHTGRKLSTPADRHPKGAFQLPNSFITFH